MDMMDGFTPELARVQEIKEAHESALLALPNVVGVGVGYKETKGETTDQVAVIVYVRRKEPIASLREHEIVPTLLEAADEVRVPPRPGERDGGTLSLEGGAAPTDVKEVGEIDALAFTARARPAHPGSSIGHFAVTAGTFGCLVRDTCSPCTIYLLSNNHVFADTNVAHLGDPILQPGAFDGGTHPHDTIAHLRRFVPIHFGTPERYNLVDAAVAEPLDVRLAVASAVGLGIPRGTAEATLDLEVVKSGRTTQTTTGTIIDVDATVAVNFGVGVGYFRHQILTTSMSAGGDSGSLLMSRDAREAIGLLFAGSAQVTVHNRIENVEMALGVTLVTA
jgi:hypothetical protein